MARNKKGILRRINDWFHLWIGIASGIPVIIISFTGALLVFEQEIKAHIIYGKWWHITPPSNTAPLPPSEIYTRVKAQAPAYQFHRFWYYGDNAPVKITPSNSDSLLFVNPYSGKILAEVDHEDMFHFIQDGHTELWMSRTVGVQVVRWSTAIFFFLLITGLVLWLPKKWNKKTVKDSFTIRWSAKLKRINYDLHNVLGFYSLLLALLITLTGLVMSFPLIRDSVFKLAGGTKTTKKAAVHLLEQLPTDGNPLHKKVDLVWEKVRTQYTRHNKTSLIINIPQKPDAPIYSCTDLHNGSWRVINFDQQTLGMLSSSDVSMKDATAANWLMRSNYAIHVGAVGGTATKTLYFIVSIICTSLPITGFYIWWGKKRKGKRKPVLNKKAEAVAGACLFI